MLHLLRCIPTLIKQLSCASPPKLSTDPTSFLITKKNLQPPAKKVFTPIAFSFRSPSETISDIKLFIVKAFLDASFLSPSSISSHLTSNSTLCIFLLVFSQQQYTGLELYLCGPVSVSIFVQFFLQLMYILCHCHFFLLSNQSIYTLLGKAVFFCMLQQKFITHPVNLHPLPSPFPFILFLLFLSYLFSYISLKISQ